MNAATAAKPKDRLSVLEISTAPGYSDPLRVNRRSFGVLLGRSTVVADGGNDPDIRVLAGMALTETDRRRRIAAVARVVREIMERERGILGVLRQAATAREELHSARRDGS